MRTKEEMVAMIAPEARGRFDLTMFIAEVDEEDFREYARENEPPETWEECEVLHPFWRDEWFRLGKLPKK